MKKRVLIFVVSSASMSLMIVIVLFLASNKLSSQAGSFLRKFPPMPIKEKFTLDLGFNSYYVAGGTGHFAYLANYTNPLHLIVLNTITADTQHVKLNIDDIRNHKFWAIRINVDSPNFYLRDGAVPIIYKGNVNTWRAFRWPYDSSYFIDLAPLNDNSFAIKAISSRSKEYSLGKIMSDTPHIKLQPNLLVKQIDGMFCVDGMMHFDKELNYMVYVYFYRNQFIVSDTNLNLVYRGRTIDTISRAQIKVAHISSNSSRTMAAPPLTVNRHSCVSGDFLFVNSNLISGNESKKAFDNASVIDVYNLKNDKYKLSFYIHDFRKNKMKGFRVFNDKLIAILGQHLWVYNLNSEYF